MPYSDGNYLTEKGRALLAKLMASQAEIEFTRASVGSGSIPEGKEPRNMESLANWQVNGVISDISSPVPGEAHLVFQVFSRDVKVGFLATEAAIWANDPDEGEILYTYIVLDNTPEWIRAASDPVQKFAEFTCINLVGTAPVDMTVINPEAIASRQFVLDAIYGSVELSSSPTPSPGVKTHYYIAKSVPGYIPYNPESINVQDGVLETESGTEKGYVEDETGTHPMAILTE